MRQLTIPCICNMEKRQMTEEAAAMQVQISSYKNRNAKGVITFLLDKVRIPFCGLDQMCLIIEAYLDRKAVFDTTISYRYIVSGTECESWQEYMTKAMSMSVCGNTHKFALRILARENQSFQGELQIENKRCCFRSGMELMRLMHQWLQLKYEMPESKEETLEKAQRICNI